MVVHDPEVCTCMECSMRQWEAIEAMRSTRPRTIEISIVRGKGEVPPFLGLYQRHFEKANPAVADTKEATITAPLDLLALMEPRGEILENIEELNILYSKGA